MKNKFKILIKIIGLLVITFTIYYLIFMFLIGESNVLKWHWFPRVIYVFISLISFGLTIDVIEDE